MGTSKNALHLATKMHALTVAIPAVGAAGLVKAAALVELSVSAASGKYRGSQLTQTKSTIAPPPVSTALVRMTNRKAHLLDHDTHFPQQSRSLTTSRAFTPREGVRTHGKFMWERGVTAARPGVAKGMAEAMGTALAKVFGS